MSARGGGPSGRRRQGTGGRSSRGSSGRGSQGTGGRDGQGASAGGGRPGRPATGGRRGAGLGRGGKAGRGTRASGDRSPGRPPAREGLGGEQVEGRQAVRELLRAGRRSARTVFVAEGMDDASILGEIESLAARRRVRVESVSRRRLDSLARTDGAQGVVALAHPVEETELDDLCAQRADGGRPFLLVLDGITDPHNVGALLRTAECAGVSGVVLPRHRSALLTPTVTKVAAGAVEYLSFALVAGIPAALGKLSERGVWTIGMDSGARQSLYDLEIAEEPVAIVLGSEGAGLGALARKRCDVLAGLPQRGRLSSLNVSAAGAIACMEIARHRSTV